jgi:hypothetical protein
MNTLRKCAALCACALFLATLTSTEGLAAEPPPAASPEPGVWQKHEYTFAYMGFTSTYSCDGLADKVKILLIAAGARKDAKSRPGACAAGFGRPDKFPRADLVFYTLTPDAGGSPVAGGSAAAGGAEQPVAGTWRSVTFTDRSPRELLVGDCELVEQFRNSVLPLFSTRDIDSHTTCIPYQESGTTINLKFEAFSAVPSGPAVKPR